MECALTDHRFHRGFTAAEKAELWDRWKRGESLKAIGRAFGKPSSSIYFLVAPHGGIRPAQRRRSRLALTLAEREVISRGVSSTNDHVRPCNLKPQQKDLTPVLRRPVEPAGEVRTWKSKSNRSAFDDPGCVKTQKSKRDE